MSTQSFPFPHCNVCLFIWAKINHILFILFAEDLPRLVTLFSGVSFNLLGCRSASPGMGVNGTTFPAQTDAVNPSQAIRPKPPNEECHLLPSLSGLPLVCPILTTTSGLGFPVGSRTVWSCKGWDNETQPNPALSHITAMNMKFPTANTDLKFRLWTMIFRNWDKKNDIP